MLKYSVQSRLFAILWALKTIHKEEPMYAVLDKVTINLWNNRQKRLKCH